MSSSYPVIDPRVRALELVGRFGRVQTTIDYLLIPRFLESRARHTAAVLQDLVVGRIRDKDRSRMVMAIAEDLGYGDGLDTFAGYFSQVKDARDTLAHHSVQRVDEATGDLMVGNMMEKDETRLTAAEIDKHLVTCDWLEAQVMFLVFKIVKTAFLNGVEMKVVRPPRKVADWDQLWYVPV